jgi:hypothetical protein
MFVDPASAVTDLYLFCVAMISGIADLRAARNNSDSDLASRLAFSRLCSPS